MSICHSGGCIQGRPVSSMNTVLRKRSWAAACTRLVLMTHSEVQFRSVTPSQTRNSTSWIRSCSQYLSELQESSILQEQVWPVGIYTSRVSQRTVSLQIHLAIPGAEYTGLEILFVAGLTASSNI